MHFKSVANAHTYSKWSRRKSIKNLGATRERAQLSIKSESVLHFLEEIKNEAQYRFQRRAKWIERNSNYSKPSNKQRPKSTDFNKNYNAQKEENRGTRMR